VSQSEFSSRDLRLNVIANGLIMILPCLDRRVSRLKRSPLSLLFGNGGRTSNPFSLDYETL